MINLEGMSGEEQIEQIRREIKEERNSKIYEGIGRVVTCITLGAVIGLTGFYLISKLPERIINNHNESVRKIAEQGNGYTYLRS